VISRLLDNAAWFAVQFGFWALVGQHLVRRCILTRKSTKADQ